MTALIKNITQTDGRVFLAIGLFVVLAYSIMLGSPFKTLDDEFSIIHNEEIRDIKNIPGFFKSTYFKSSQDYYRPLVYVTYTLEYRVFGLNPVFYNLDNVLLHALNAFLIFLLAGFILRDRTLAFFVAFLFAVHPIHWEAVDNVSGRAILLCATGVLGGFAAFLAFLQKRKAGYLALSAACYALGLLAKESAGVLLAVIFFYLLIVERKRGKDLLIVWPFACVAAGYIVIRHALGITKVFPWQSASDMALGFLSFLNGVLVYLGLFLVPVGLRFDRAHPLFASFSDPVLWLTVAVFVLAAIFLLRIRSRVSGLVFFCMLWFAVELFPVSQIVTSIGVYPGAILLAEHFVYVASVPIFLLMVMAVDRSQTILIQKKLASVRILKAAVGGFVLFLACLLVQQNIYASHEFLMVREALTKDPRNARLQYSMGLLYVKAKEFDLAREHFREAVKTDPFNARYRIAYGKALVDTNDLLAAAREYESIGDAKNLSKTLFENKRALYEMLVAQYKKAALEKPDDATVAFALGVFYFKLEKMQAAAEAFDTAARIDPLNKEARSNLAVTCAILKGKGEPPLFCSSLPGIVPPAAEGSSKNP